MKAAFLLVFAALLLSGCSQTPDSASTTPDAQTPVSYPAEHKGRPMTVVPNKGDLRRSTATKQERVDTDFIEQAYAQWKGTPYRFGGTNKSGVDCSGFVQSVFAEQLEMDLPRSTSEQVQMGESIKKDQLTYGDLVFFKLPRGVQHVGIYLGEGKFMHASTRRGVIISEMGNVYWRNKYWTARRVL